MPNTRSIIVAQFILLLCFFPRFIQAQTPETYQPVAFSSEAYFQEELEGMVSRLADDKSQLKADKMLSKVQVEKLKVFYENRSQKIIAEILLKCYGAFYDIT